MINEGSLVIYKSKPAIVKEKDGGKFSIALADGESVKVRDKDIELIHGGPVKNFDFIKSGDESFCDSKAVREAWELLSGESEPLPLKDAASFIFGGYTPSSAYAVYCLLRDGLFFSGAIESIAPKSAQEVAAEEAKRGEKLRETGERTRFLERVKAQIKNPSQKFLLPDDLQLTQRSKFLQDVEALAYGKTIKSRTMKDLNLGETPEDAHSLLLKTGFWTPMVNPHPGRFGLSLSPANYSSDQDGASPETRLLNEERRDLCHLDAFAIDSPWSTDPDDAVSIEIAANEDSAAGDFTGCTLYVHIADPASSIVFDSPAEKEARDRGVTLYLPETTVRMLAEESIPAFALGISEKSPALTFKMTINKKGETVNVEIFPSVIKARRVTYEDADRLIDTDGSLRALFNLSQKLSEKRTANGAVNIEYTEVHITIENESVKIEPIINYKSALLVKECMIAANEGAGNWAASRGLPFPYISQEVELDNQISVKSGIAGSLQLRRCMRPRVLSVKPGRHQGLGLDIYSQVTSPLRRYTDLLAHIQIRAFLHGNRTLSADEISTRLGFSEAASAAAVHAERASVNHWIMVYLCDKKESVFDAVAIENKGSRWAALIPSLALETQVSLNKNVSPNDTVKLVLKSVNIAKGEAIFTQG